MEEKITFGKFVSQKRKNIGLTQKELAEKLYVTESAVSKWERGVSYPDISMVRDICAALQISEHELITASDDLYQRKLEKQAKNFRTIVKTYSWAFYLMYGIALVTCFICNLAVNHTLSWFFIVLTSIMVAFSLTCVPILMEKHRGMVTLGTFFVSLLLLLMTCCIYTGGDWFWITAVSVLFGFFVVFGPLVLRALPQSNAISRHKTLTCFTLDTIFLFVLLAVALPFAGQGELLLTLAFPIALCGLSFAWILMLVIRYLPINGGFKAAICSIVSGAYTFISNSILSVVIDGEPFVLLSWNFRDWTEPFLNGNITMLTSAAFLLAALLFLIGGIIFQVKRSSNDYSCQAAIVDGVPKYI